jgi:tripartite-type tricarboxylate transporter receptor subunit TctC
MRKLFPAIIGLATALGIASACAQTYPSRPITLLVPFAAGGPADALARALGERMRASLGQTVIIENATGASGTIGVGRVVRAAPDGYTLGIGHVGTHVVNGAIFALPYDLLKDLEPVALLPSNSLLIISKKAFPANDLKELIAWLKANPDKASAGTSGAGGGSHVNGVYFQNLTGTRFQFVPYRGTGPALTDLIAGQIDLMFDQASKFARAGACRHHQSIRGHRQGAAAFRTRDSYGRRGRLARVLYVDVVRAVGPAGHT